MDLTKTKDKESAKLQRQHAPPAEEKKKRKRA